jgi:hypothetical protein
LRSERLREAFYNLIEQRDRCGSALRVIHSRKRFEQASKMQTNMIDQLMDAWQEQLKSPMPGPFNVQLPPFPVMGFGASQNSTFQIAPVQVWMEAAEAWQRNWASAWSMWTGQAAGMGARGRAKLPR